MRLLLLHVRGEHATSWESLRRAPAPGADSTHQQLARELGLLQDDVEIANMLSESVHVLTSLSSLCNLMAETLVWLDVSDPVALWTHFHTLMRSMHAGIELPLLYGMVSDALSQYSLTLTDFGIPVPLDTPAELLQSKASKDYAAELRTGNQLIEERLLCDALPLNSDQQAVYDHACALLENPSQSSAGNLMFVDGPAGSGKTHLYRKLLHFTRSTGRIALAVCMSGIAALLLPGGRTAHYRFRLPVPVPLDGCSCNVKAQSASDLRHGPSSCTLALAKWY